MEGNPFGEFAWSAAAATAVTPKAEDGEAVKARAEGRGVTATVTVKPERGTKRRHTRPTRSARPRPRKKARHAARVRSKREDMAHYTQPLPFVAGAFGSPYRDRFVSTCQECFDAHQACSHYAPRRLRLLLVGHNPSTHAWQSGFPYSNPSNNMVKLLRGRVRDDVQYEGLVSPTWTIGEMNVMPDVYGIGVVDIGTDPGSNAAVYSKQVMLRWRAWFYKRAVHAMRDVQRQTSSKVKEGSSVTMSKVKEESSVTMSKVKEESSVTMSKVKEEGSSMAVPACGGRKVKEEDDVSGSQAGGTAAVPRRHRFEDSAPHIVAFTGKRQFSMLFEPPLKRCQVGRQEQVPPGWPFPASTQVWVLTSSSGRAAMTQQARAAPYKALAAAVRAVGLEAAKAHASGSEV